MRIDNQRRIVLKLGAGIVTLLCVGIALAAAHDASLLRAGKVVCESSDAHYFYTVREVPVKPNEQLASDGTFPSGYYYICSVSKSGIPVSSYTLIPDKPFKAGTVAANPLPMVRRTGLMTAFDLEGINGVSYFVVCRALNPDHADPDPDFRWHSTGATGE